MNNRLLSSQLSFFLFLICSLSLQGNGIFSKKNYFFQDTICIPDASSEVFKVADEMPRFPGCEHLEELYERRQCANQLLLDFIDSNLSYPEEALENEIEGSVIVQFIIEKEGCLSNINIARDLGYGTGEEVIRLIELMNHQEITWIPGKHSDTVVRVEYTLPIQFKLDSTTSTITSSSLPSVLIFPNPTSSICYVNILSKQSMIAQYAIVDLFGNKLVRNSIHLSGGANSYSIPLSFLNSGQYLFCLYNQEHRLIAKEMLLVH